jgi:Ca2+-transporting ATPase
MIDPARTEVAPAVARARKAGLRTVMVTGDYKDTAAAVAREIGILRPEGRVISGAEIEAMDDEALRKIIHEVDVCARVAPNHKVRIVEALKARGEVVSMTGDGVNDAPALKRANIGVAMGITGTDVTKQTADMVLTDDNYVSIVSAIEQGRIIYSNIRKFVYFLVSCNLAEIAIIFIATLAGWPSPLTAIQLLWLNLLTDGAPALALGMEKGDPDIMDRPPRPPQEPVINREMLIGVAVQTVAITAAVLIAYWRGMMWEAEQGMAANVVTAETMAFVTLVLSELFRAYTSRSERYPLFKLGVFTNKYMQYAVGFSILLLLPVVYIPALQPIFGTMTLTAAEWMLIIPLVMIPAVANEVQKYIMNRIDRRKLAALAAEPA